LDKGERTKATIVATTAGLLQEHGLRATGINQIIATSGTPKGSLYYHFPGGKEELACLALESAARTWRVDLQTYMAKFPAPSAAIHAACKVLGKRLKESGFSIGCPIATVLLEVRSDEDAIRKVCDDHFQAWEDFLVDRLLSDGGNKREARPWAIMVLSAIEGALLLSKARRNTNPLRDAGALLQSQLAPRAASLTQPPQSGQAE
jgi:TetR/AcrR family transcriptional repressor of lmrAB and yxaGH operons